VFSLFRILAIGLSLALFGGPSPAEAAKSLSFIRDAEVENTIRVYATPLFRAAGLHPEHVNIYIVNDNALNAFVAGGQKLFMNTGLILAAEDAGEVIGVIAHETGHIAGGHLARLHDALSKGSAASVLAMILGGAATLATGRGDVGAAVALGGQTAAMRNFLAYSRVQESAADQAALKFLDETETSAKGLLEFMEKLGDQELLSARQQDPYVRTHPLTRDRISAVGEHVRLSRFSEHPIPMDLQQMHERMKAKIYAFVNPLRQTLRLYKEDDTSVPSRYARSVGYYRQHNLDIALPLIDGLIAEEPENAYFHELRGQMLFDNARLSEALVSYGKAANLAPGSALIRRELARAQIEYNKPEFLKAAVINLEASLAVERRTPFTWHLLGIAHGRLGDDARSSLALAEEALLENKADIAERQAGAAQRQFKEGTREWLQADDILLAAKDMKSRQQRQKK